MNSSVLKESFKEGISIGERVAAKSPSLPILNNVLIVAEKNFVEIGSTDLEIGVRYQILGKNEKEGSVVVSPRTLSQFFSVLPGPQVVLKTKEKGLEIESRGFHAVFKTLNPEDFPIIPSLKEGAEFLDLDTAALCRGLASVANFTGQSQARPEISGIYFSFQKNVLRLVGTDSFRLAEKTLYFKKENATERSFILPPKAARELVSIFGERTGKTRVFFSPTQVIFDYSNEGEPGEPKVQMVSRLIEGEYPSYQDVIPQKPSTTARVPREEFLNHLKAASVFAGRMNDARVLFDPEKRGLEVISQSQEVGENTSFLEASIRGPKTEVAFNWRFLSDGLLQMKSSEVEIGVTGEDGPALIKPVQDEGYLYVVMPIKA